ncbi:MAG: OmpA family protein [Cyclobacteriaceae bacterium]
MITRKYLIVLKLVWCLCLIGTYLRSNAQEGDCTNVISSTKCVTIDISESMTAIDKKFEIQWHLDDGTMATGPIVKHCFEKFGEHTAQMNLKDRQTGILYENEYTASISINPPADLKLPIPDSLEIGLPLSLDYHLSGDYSVAQGQWSIDGKALTPEQVKAYQFLKPGKAQVELALGLTFDGQPYAICAQKEVTIYGTNIALESFQKFYHPDAGTESRFLKASYFLSVANKTQPAQSKTIELQKQGYYYEAATESQYELQAWHGNSLSEKVTFSTEDMGAEESQMAFDSALKQLLQTQPKSLSPMFHLFDEAKLDEASKGILDKNIALLKKNQNCKVLVGTYTHTGGYWRSNVKLSKRRSGLVREYLINGGLKAERVAIADPMNEKDLINSCGFVGCEREDPSLNRRTDFKLIISEKP